MNEIKKKINFPEFFNKNVFNVIKLRNSEKIIDIER